MTAAELLDMLQRIPENRRDIPVLVDCGYSETIPLAQEIIWRSDSVTLRTTQRRRIG
jgi:hypothetical protein